MKDFMQIAVCTLPGGVAALLFRDDTISPEAALEAAEALTALQADHAAVVLASEHGALCAPTDAPVARAAAQSKNWAALLELSANYQALTQAVRFSTIPVVTLGQGAVTDYGLELASASAFTMLARDAQVGYNTPKVGYAPMGGGVVQAALAAYGAVAGVPGADAVPFLKRAFQQLYSGKLVSAQEAVAKGYLPRWTAVVDAPRCTLELAAELALCAAHVGYHPPEPAVVTVKGLTAKGALDVTALNASLGKFLPESLLRVAKQVSWVLSGGDVPDRTELSEAQLLALEREAFVRTLQEG